MDSILSALKNNYLAVIIALIIGLVCIAPHIVFKVSLGSDYQGIYLMQTANELEYLGRMQEIADGHWNLGSVPFFEYKNNPSLMPSSILEILFAGASWLLKISISNLVILSKFFLPALLFLLIYFLIYQITGAAGLLSGKINAITAGLLIVLGYDLIDYRSLWSYFKGINSPGDFLLWTRPINPILGGILIYSFLMLVWHLYQNKNGKYKYILIFCGGLVLAMAITSYFFSWGMILSLVGILGIIALLKKRYDFIKKLFLICLCGFVLASPYFYNIFLASHDISYQESVLRTGLFLGHKPIFNIFLIFSLAIFLILSFFFRNRTKEKIIDKEWWLFSLCLILAGFIAFNQQIITGRAIWPFHFVQYSIPLCITALFVIFYYFKNINKKTNYLWSIIIAVAITASLSFGIYVQASAYKQSYREYKEKQKYADAFNWINKNTEKDCVILSEDRVFLSRAIPAFTHCNVYLSNFTFFLLPTDRLHHNYFTYLRLRGISADGIEGFINDNSNSILLYLYATQTMVKFDFKKYENVLAKMKKDYKKFLTKDFTAELKKYKLDYLVSEKQINADSLNFGDNLKLVYAVDNIFIYQLQTK